MERMGRAWAGVRSHPVVAVIASLGGSAWLLTGVPAEIGDRLWVLEPIGALSGDTVRWVIWFLGVLLLMLTGGFVFTRLAPTEKDGLNAPDSEALTVVEDASQGAKALWRIRVQNRGPQGRFRVKVERLSGTGRNEDGYYLPWRLNSGGAQSPWNEIARGENEIIEVGSLGIDLDRLLSLGPAPVHLFTTNGPSTETSTCLSESK